MASARLRLRDKLTFFKRATTRRGLYQDPPLVTARRIYVNHANPSEVQRPQDSEIVALDRQTLATEWRVKTDSLAPSCEWDETLLIVGNATRVAAFDTSSGRVVWTMPRSTGAHRWSGKLLVFEPDDHVLVSVDVSSGEKERFLVSRDPVSSSVASEKTLIINLRSNFGLHRAYDLRTRSLLWESDLPQEAHRVYGIDPISVSRTPGSLPGRFVITCGLYTLGCSLASGEILWKADAWCTYYRPLVQGGRIPILNHEEFVVLDEATGAVLCRRKHGLAQVWHAKKGSLVSDNVFGSVSEQGHVMLFDMNTAELLSWAQHNVMFQGTAAADGRFFVVGSDGKLWVYEPFA